MTELVLVPEEQSLKEEGGGNSTLNNHTMDDDNNDHGKITQQSNSLWEREWMILFFNPVEIIRGGGGEKGAL